MRRIDIRDIAEKANVCVGTIRKHVSGLRPTRLLDGLPAPIARGTKLLWLEEDIDKWLASQSTQAREGKPVATSHQPVMKRGRGRPRKSEQTI